MDALTFFDQLRQSQVLSDEQLAAARQRFLGKAAPAEIAGALQAEGLLTTFQAKQIVAGQGKGLALGQYRLLDELGRGGFGQVYRAVHTLMNRVVAIKVIAPERVEDCRARSWFRREVLAVTQLHHPNIVMAYDANEVDGALYFVMEYVDGPNLDRFIKQKGPLSARQAGEMLRQAGLALQYANDKGMVHRDIKPGNLLIPRLAEGAPGLFGLSSDPVILKVVDFGLARLQTGSFQTLVVQGDKGFMGTPDYVAPEQARDYHHADIRSDLYSLGCTFYFALTGRRPFEGQTVYETVVKHLEQEPEPLEKVRPDLPPELIAVVRRLMAKKPEDRFQKPADLVAALAGPDRPPPGLSGLHPMPQLPDRPAAPSVTATRLVPQLAFNNFVAKEGASVAVEDLGPTRLTPGFPDTDAGGGETYVAPAPLLPPTPSFLGEPLPLPSDSVSSVSGEFDDEPVAIDPMLCRRWDQWTALQELHAAGAERIPITEAGYRELYRELLQMCRSHEPADPEAELRLRRRMGMMVEPWLTLKTMAKADRPTLASLAERCRQLEARFAGHEEAKAPGWPVGRLAVLVAVTVLISLAWRFGWLGGVTRADWSTVSPGRFIAENLMLLIACLLPVMLTFSAVLLSRSARK